MNKYSIILLISFAILFATSFYQDTIVTHDTLILRDTLPNKKVIVEKVPIDVTEIQYLDNDSIVIAKMRIYKGFTWRNKYINPFDFKK